MEDSFVLFLEAKGCFGALSMAQGAELICQSFGQQRNLILSFLVVPSLNISNCVQTMAPVT